MANTPVLLGTLSFDVRAYCGRMEDFIYEKGTCGLCAVRLFLYT